MRTIKFRAWDKEKKEMIFEGLEYWIRLLDVGSDWKKKSNPPIGFIKEHDYKRFIVQQFTGLTDKNGKEIYEGDIIHSKWSEAYVGQDDSKMIVYWSNKNGAWSMNEKGKDIQLGNFYLRFHCHPKHIKVIGNIYESPELLKIK